MLISNMKLKKIKGSKYLLEFSTEDFDFDLIIELNRNRVKSILQGTITDKNVFMDVEKYTDTSELVKDINEYIKEERIKVCERIRKAYHICSDIVNLFYEIHKIEFDTMEKHIFIKIHMQELLFDSKDKILTALRSDVNAGNMKAIDLYRNVLMF